ncbi:HdeD family acid-resistance protein [Segnochrobactraceae bacterium EtOH-i3]
MAGPVSSKSLQSRLVGGPKGWIWFVVLGIALIALGLFAGANLFASTLVTIFYIGILMLFAGIAEILHAIGVKEWRGFLFSLISGLFYCAAGFFAFYDPTRADAVFTLLLAVALIAAGLLRLIVGFTSRAQKGWGWIVAGGVVTTLLGLMILTRWPFDSLWVLGLFLSIDLIFQGWAFVAVGFGLRTLARR